MLRTPQFGQNASWKQRFRAAHVAWMQLARANPARGLAVSTQSGQYQLYAWDVTANQMRQLTSRPEGVPFGLLSPDGRFIYYMQDSGGNEIGHFVRLPFGGGAAQDITPERPPYSAFGISASRAGNLLASTVSDSEGFHTLVLPVEAGDKIGMPREIYHSRKIMFGPSLSHSGEIGVITSRDRSDFQHYSLIALNTKTRERIAELWEDVDSGFWSFGFSPLPGDYRFLAISNRTGFSRPLIWNPVTGERSELPLSEFPGDVSPLDWSEDGRYLLLAQSHQAKQRLAVYDLMNASLTYLRHPDGYYSLGTLLPQSNELLTVWQDTTHPPQVIALDFKTGYKRRDVLRAGEVPAGHPWKHVTFKSHDGEMIQGWLAVPEGKGPFPTVLHTHGGPETETVEYFLPASQAWLDHGFAWLAINYRGSTGSGRAFREKIWGNPGYWEVEDMVAARDWLVQEAISIPNQILLTGWSYGGYLTLLALSKYPGLWAGGMAGTATVDWAAEYEDLSPALRGYSVALFGGTLQEKPEQYLRSSPISYVEQLREPVLIIQGRNDTRTPPRPVEIYQGKLRELGKPAEVHWFDEGHLGGGVEQDIEHMEIMLRFAYRVISGRVGE